MSRESEESKRPGGVETGPGGPRSEGLVGASSPLAASTTYLFSPSGLPRSIKVAKVLLTWAEIISYVDSFRDLAAMSRVCVAWRGGVKRAPVHFAIATPPLPSWQFGQWRASFPQAVSLRARHGKVFDDDLLKLSGMSSLRELNLPGMKRAPVEALAALCRGAGRLSGLVSLTLDYSTGVTEEVVELVATLPSLEVLNVAECACYGQEGCEAIARIPALRELRLGATRGLKARCMRGSSSSGAPCRTAEGAPDRSCVCITGPSELGFVTLASGLTQLTRLSACDFKLVSDAALSAVGGMVSLRALDMRTIRGPSIGPSTLERLSGLTNLVSLKLSECEWALDAGLHALRTLVKLESLCLNRSPVRDEGVARLLEGGAVPCLRDLSLEGTEISDALLTGALSERSGLARLWVGGWYGTKVTLSGIASLKEAVGEQLQVMTVMVTR